MMYLLISLLIIGAIFICIFLNKNKKNNKNTDVIETDLKMDFVYFINKQNELKK